MDKAVLEVPPGYHPFYRNDLFYHSVGPMFVKNLGHEIRFGLRVQEKHCNASMICHGGVLATILDMQIGVGSCVGTEITALVPTINLTCDFLAPAQIGDWVEARSEVARQTRRMIFVSGMLEVEGRPVLRGNGIVKIPSKPENPEEFANIFPPVYHPEDKT